MIELYKIVILSVFLFAIGVVSSSENISTIRKDWPLRERENIESERDGGNVHFCWAINAECCKDTQRNICCCIKPRSANCSQTINCDSKAMKCHCPY